MKKVLIIISALLIAFGGLLFAPRSQAETSTQDQYCAAGDESGYEMLGAGGVVRSQTFEPTQNRVTEIDVKIGGLNLNGGTPITITLYGPNFDGPQLATKTIMPTIGVPSTRSWTFASPVTVTPGSIYKIVMSTAGPGSVYWYYGTGGVACDGNDRTYAFRDSTHMTWDWNYKTQGYTVSDPSTPGTTDTGTTPGGTTGSSAASSEALGTTTTSISKPSNLTAAYSQTENGVKLSWKASATSDIDGYKVFRSESQNSGYSKIAETAKTKVEAIDQAIVAGKTYYYQVRAYKGSSQSISSNTATVSVPEDIAPAKPINFKVVDRTDSFLTMAWRKTEDSSIASYTLNLYKGNEKVRTVSLKPTENIYSFLSLDAGTLYKAELIAVNNKGQAGSPAITWGYTTSGLIDDDILYSAWYASAVGILILVLILAIRTKLHYRKTK